MSIDLRHAVERGLEVIGAISTPRSGGILEVELPPSSSHHFPAGPRLRLVFDQDVWQHDRTSELVVPGSAVLEGLEAALRERGACIQRVGGDLVPDPTLQQTWSREIQILNGELRGPHATLEFARTLRFLYEVRLPDESMELVPIAWSPTTGVLTAAQLAKLARQAWYDPEEMRGLGVQSSPIEPQQVAKARASTEAALRERVAPFLGPMAQERQDEAAQRDRRYRDEAHQRAELLPSLSPREREARLQEIAEELQARLHQNDQLREASFEVRELTLQVYELGRCELALDYTETTSGAAIRVPVPTRGGRIRMDLCATCEAPRERYYLVLDAAQGPLVCDDCGALCAADECGAILSRNGESACAICPSPKFCASHVTPCAECGANACPDHGLFAECGRWLCPAHPPRPARDGRKLCREHAAVCAVDGLLTHISDLVICPLSGARLYRGNAVQPPGDERLLHPDQVVTCSITHQMVARDRAGVCSADGASVRLDLLLASDEDEALLCPNHSTIVDQPPGTRVRTDIVEHCTSTGQSLAPSAAERCSVDGRVYWTQLMVTCPISGRRLLRDAAVAVDDRLVHPDCAVTCSHTGRTIAKDRATSCPVDQALVGVDIAVQTTAGELVCPDHATSVDVPAGEVVRSDQVATCAETGATLAPSAVGRCSVRHLRYRQDLLVRCPLTGQLLHRDETVTPRGDTRGLHPSACVTVTNKSELVARDRAVEDGVLAGRTLHPDDVGTCQLTGGQTLRSELAIAACCGRAVHKSFAGLSPISGRRWCVDHRQRCDEHRDWVLPDEHRTCDATGVSLCTQHVVQAECGATVARIVAHRLPHGWGCPTHYGPCGGDLEHLHAALVAELSQCPVCGASACLAHTQPDPYDPTSRTCTRHSEECPLCLQFAPFDAGSTVCRRCAEVTRLTQYHPANDAYKRTLRPKLPTTLRVLPTVRVSGTEGLWVFRVSGPLGSATYLLQGDVVSVKRASTWETV